MVLGANIKLQEYLHKYHLSDLDRRFFTELVYGVIRRKEITWMPLLLTLQSDPGLKKPFYGCGNP